MSPLVSLSITIFSIALAAAMWACMSGVMFGRFGERGPWFNSESWENKYLLGSGGVISSEWYFFHKGNIEYSKIVKPKLGVLPQWYYDHFKIKYLERFPFSATALVFVTDFFHACQWFAIKMICIAVAVNTPFPVVMFFLLWLIWVVAFQLVYLRLKE